MSLVHKVFEGTTASTGTAFHPRRLTDELGRVQVTLSGGTSPTAILHVEGRLAPDMPYDALLTVDETDLETSSLSAIVELPVVLPDMRIRLVSVTGGATVTVWIAE